LLQALAASPRAMMLRDLAAAADMSPAKAHRYLVSFQRLGAVTQDAVSQRYDLGPFALQLGLAGLNRLDPVRKARPILSQLRDEIDQTAGIAVWGNHGPTIVHWEESSHPVSASLRLGDVMPMLNSATGRLYGAYLSRRQTLPLIERELATRGTVPLPDMPVSLDEYDAICADVRARRGTHARRRVAGHQRDLHARVRREWPSGDGADRARRAERIRCRMGRYGGSARARYRPANLFGTRLLGGNQRAGQDGQTS
jgi:DNA-binding IclR family transcriptional regulator